MKTTARICTVMLVGVLALAGCRERAAEPPVEAAPAAPKPVAQITPADLLPNGGEPLKGIVTGGQPTIAQLERARDAGFKTVINLRLESESGAKRAEVEALGLEYVAIPVAGREGLTSAKAKSLSKALQRASGPVLLHCASGNRVGALIAVMAHEVQGASAEEALALGKLAGLKKLEPDVRELLGLE